MEKDKLDKKKVSSTSLKKLIELDLVKIIKEEKYRINIDNNTYIKPELTYEQQNVVNKVNLNQHDTYLQKYICL